MRFDAMDIPEDDDDDFFDDDEFDREVEEFSTGYDEDFDDDLFGRNEDELDFEDELD